jgi:hypothetical protein
MQAFAKQQLVKPASTNIKLNLPRQSAARPAAPRNTGRRFLDALMAALAGPAV